MFCFVRVHLKNGDCAKAWTPGGGGSFAYLITNRDFFSFPLLPKCKAPPSVALNHFCLICNSKLRGSCEDSKCALIQATEISTQKPLSLSLCATPAHDHEHTLWHAHARTVAPPPRCCRANRFPTGAPRCVSAASPGIITAWRGRASVAPSQNAAARERSRAS